MKMQDTRGKIQIYFIALIFLLAFAGQSWAVTRFYLPSTGSAAVSPAYSASWNDTSNADRLKCVTTKINSAMTAKAMLNTASIGHFLFRQYVSDPIAAQTITGTVAGQVKGAEGHAGVDGFSDITIRVVSNNGATVRGTLLAITFGATEFFVSTTATENRKTPTSTAVSIVTAEANDRIVIEIGALKNGNKNNNIQLIFGDDNAGDLPVDETTQTALNPWVQFSQTINFASARRRVMLIN